MGIFGKAKFAFENYGGTYQLRLKTAADLEAIIELDEPFWMATSAPVNQFKSDPVLLERLDKDHNSRLQSWEIREAARWLLEVLRDRSAIDARSDEIKLAALDTRHAAARALHETAKQVLQSLGDEKARSLTLNQIRAHKDIFSRSMHNGDGVIPPENVGEDDLKNFVQDIINTVGGAQDHTGAVGVNHDRLNHFLQEAREYCAWHTELEAASDHKTLLPFGETTAERHGAYAKLAPVIDAFYQQCQVVILNNTLDRSTEDFICPPDTLQGTELAGAYLAQAPLAKPGTELVLPLQKGVNPHYADALSALADEVFKPLLGNGFSEDALTLAQWDKIKTALAPYTACLNAKRGVEVEALGLERLRSCVDIDLPLRLGGLIETDIDAGKALAALHNLEYLVLLQIGFLDICNNFVSFPCLYDPDRRAAFEMGRLVMDRLVFNLNLPVPDVAAHSAAAARSGMYLMYSEVTCTPDDAPFYIVTPVTNGDINELGMGKRGVLFDLDGREWDTRVVQVVENPINLREAMLAPFKRLARLVSATTERVTTGVEAQLTGQISQAGTGLETGLKSGIATPPAAAITAPPATEAPVPNTNNSTGGFRDIALFGGVAVAALGSSFAYIAQTFSNMNGWHVVCALAAGLAIVLIPTTLIAAIKLRRRNLSTILEASGWTINAPMRLTRNLRALIVQAPAHPKSIRRLPEDLIKAFSRSVSREKAETDE
jgi:hypothetical protein